MIVVSVSAAASSPARPASAQPRMRLFAHPLRLDNAGAIATVEQGSAVHAQQLTIAIVSTHLGERALAPDFGIFVPTEMDTSKTEIAAAVDLCVPGLTVAGAEISQANGRQNVSVTVAWDLSGEDI